MLTAPGADGRFGEFGGRFVPETLVPACLELERAFDDLTPFAQQCRFDDCTHTTEPGCGLIEALERGAIDADRLELWRSLVDELEQLEDGLEVRDREVRRQTNQRSRRRAKRRDLVVVGDEDLDEDHWGELDDQD